MACSTPTIYDFKTLSEQKSFLRKRAKSALKEYCSDQKLMEQCALSCLNSVTKSEIYQNADFILAFMPLFDEMPIFKILVQAFLDKKKVLIPKIVENSNEMEFYFIPEKVFSLVLQKKDFTDSADFKNLFSIQNPFKILEPDSSWQKLDLNLLPQKSLIFVPGLAFNLEGLRLGRGKGFYDRFLTEIKEKNIVRCGVCFTICVTKAIPVEKTDQKVDFLLTEYGLVKC